MLHKPYYAHIICQKKALEIIFPTGYHTCYPNNKFNICDSMKVERCKFCHHFSLTFTRNEIPPPISIITQTLLYTYHTSKESS